MSGKLIKKLRLERGLTLQALADHCQISKGYLSKLERSEKLPPFSTLQTLSRGLGVDLENFFNGRDHPDRGGSKNIEVAKGKKGLGKFVDGEGYAYLPLLKNFRQKYMSPFLMKVPKGVTKHFSHDAEEFVYVLSGRVTLIYEDRRYALSEGDSFYLDSRIKHAFLNSNKKHAVLLAVHMPYRRF